MTAEPHDGFYTTSRDVTYKDYWFRYKGLYQAGLFPPIAARTRPTGLFGVETTSSH
jgi:hypothetical protein